MRGKTAAQEMENHKAERTTGRKTLSATSLGFAATRVIDRSRVLSHRDKEHRRLEEEKKRWVKAREKERGRGRVGKVEMGRR